MKNKLTKKQKKELEKITNDMMGDAKHMVDDYVKNPSEISGSVVEINENSPFLEEKFKGDSWKKIVQGSVEEAMEMVKFQKNTKSKMDEYDEKHNYEAHEEPIIETSVDEAQILKQIQEKERMKKFEQVVQNREMDKYGHTLNNLKKNKKDVDSNT